MQSDKRYFEIYELKLEHEIAQVQKMETEDFSDTSFFSAGVQEANVMVNESPLKAEPTEPELENRSDVAEAASENNTGSSHESVDEEYDETEVEDNSLAQDKRKRANLVSSE